MGECMLSRVLLFATPWTITHQALLSMGFSRHGYWSGLPFPPLADLPNPGTELEAPESPALVGGFFTTESPGKPLKRQSFCYVVFILCVYSITEPQRRLVKTDCWPGTQSFWFCRVGWSLRICISKLPKCGYCCWARSYLRTSGPCDNYCRTHLCHVIFLIIFQEDGSPRIIYSTQ